MSAPLRLGLFALLLAAVYGGAFLAGSLADGDEPRRAVARSAHTEDKSATAAGAAHGAEEAHGEEPGGSEAAGAAVPGLAVTSGGLRLVLDRTRFDRGRPQTLRLRLLGEDGQVVRDFDVSHERKLHLIVVRRDGRGFQHLHPRQARDGSWSTRLTLPDAGMHRVFADVTRDGEALTLGTDLAVDGRADYRTLPPAVATASAGDGYEVRLDAGDPAAGAEADLAFTVTRDGEAVHTEPYLGAGGHLVALREGDLAYLHTHPDDHGDGEAASGHDDSVPFATTFPSAGRYRLYFQFRHGGKVRTAAFTQEVAR